MITVDATRCDCCGVVDGTVDGGLCDECFRYMPEGRWILCDDLTDAIEDGMMLVSSNDWNNR